MKFVRSLVNTADGAVSGYVYEVRSEFPSTINGTVYSVVSLNGAWKGTLNGDQCEPCAAPTYRSPPIGHYGRSKLWAEVVVACIKMNDAIDTACANADAALTEFDSRFKKG